MRKARRPARGQPLAALVFVLLCWIGLRAASWDNPLLAPTRHEPQLVRETVLPVAAGGASRVAPTLSRIAPSEARDGPAGVPPLVLIRRSRTPVANYRSRLPVGRRSDRRAFAFSTPPPDAEVASPDHPPVAMTRALLAEDRATASRWSGDAWLLLRRGGQVSLASGPGFVTYGASQAGAVLRYRLAPGSGHRPAAYVRATAALNGSGEREAAAGLSARPVAAVPVAVLAELRVTRQPGGTRLRPAAMAVTELPPVDLPQRFRAEAYGQAGYVGGRYATAFVDGQLRLDRGLAKAGPADLRLGAGAWGGAQKGASRLDLGPTASASLAVGPGLFVRVAADWRFRMAGNAAPASGPALTLSAGF